MLKLGHFSKVITESLALRVRLLADGTPEPEADRIVGQGLKTAWGTLQREPWRYVCRRCRDTGFREVLADGERWRRLYGDCAPEPFYTQCDVDCAYLAKERRWKLQKAGEAEGLEAAGQTKKARRW